MKGTISPAGLATALFPLLASVTAIYAHAPVPPQDDRAKLAQAYGVWTDPDKDCNFKLTGGELKVSLPAPDHLLQGKPFVPRVNNAPRALREVAGDFTAVVRVAIPIPDRIPKRNWPYCSGGLVAWESDERFFVVRLCGGLIGGDRETVWGYYQSEQEGDFTTKGLGKPTGKGFLRLKREGKNVTAGWSRDGTTWKEFKPQEVAWGAKVKVGVVAENNLGKPVEVAFDHYQLTQPKKK